MTMKAIQKKRGPKPGTPLNPKSLANLIPGGGRRGKLGKKWSAGREIADHLLDDEYWRLAAMRIKAGKAPHLELYFLQLKYGKPKDTVELSGPNGGPIPFADMTPEEKRERAAAVLSRLAALGVAPADGDPGDHSRN